jgi:Asp-tRNA(Asn)/Glu-tRNA(Gln) amidotransferase A subunit family amidase
MTAQTDLCYASISELSERIRTRQLSPVELTEAVLDRIARYDEALRVYITVTAELAREQARAAEREIAAGRYRGPLHGIPLSLKDNIETQGIRTSCASLVNPDWVPERDATVYAKLREAGAILLGKANLFEYAFSMTPAFPQPLNPWHPERSSSGSSSGSAVGVATGMAFGSIGTDTGG